MAQKSEIQIVGRRMKQAPVDLKAIFADLGIDYKEVQMNESGEISRTGDSFTVRVNETESETRRRFTAAHELGHYLLHRDLMGDGKTMHRHGDSLYGTVGQSGNVTFNREHEVQANRIAAQIVMPKKLVEAKFVETKEAGALAKQFGVSKAAMEIRLRTLGLA